MEQVQEQTSIDPTVVDEVYSYEGVESHQKLEVGKAVSSFSVASADLQAAIEERTRAIAKYYGLVTEREVGLASSLATHIEFIAKSAAVWVSFIMEDPAVQVTTAVPLSLNCLDAFGQFPAFAGVMGNICRQAGFADAVVAQELLDKVRQNLVIWQTVAAVGINDVCDGAVSDARLGSYHNDVMAMITGNYPRPYDTMINVLERADRCHMTAAVVNGASIIDCIAKFLCAKVGQSYNPGDRNSRAWVWCVEQRWAGDAVTDVTVNQVFQSALAANGVQQPEKYVGLKDAILSRVDVELDWAAPTSIPNSVDRGMVGTMKIGFVRGVALAAFAFTDMDGVPRGGAVNSSVHGYLENHYG